MAALAKAEGNLKIMDRFGILHNGMCKLHKQCRSVFPYTRIKCQKRNKYTKYS